MASTNKTTNYELSQYVGSDKPSYLNDYNQDMSKIDLGIHAAKSEADTNATAIGDLTTLTTTVKTDLVSAINEVDSEASTANATAVQADGKADTNATAIGTLANLDTTVKTDLVSAINEVDGNVGTTQTNLDNFISLFNFVNFSEYTDQNISYVDASKRVIKVKTAFNEDYSIGKIYGILQLNVTGYLPKVTLQGVLPSGYRPSSDITINGLMTILNSSNNSWECQGDVTFKTNGDVTIEFASGIGSGSVGITIHPCLLFMKDFGDTAQ